VKAEKEINDGYYGCMFVGNTLRVEEKITSEQSPSGIEINSEINKMLMDKAVALPKYVK